MINKRDLVAPVVVITPDVPAFQKKISITGRRKSNEPGEKGMSSARTKKNRRSGSSPKENVALLAVTVLPFLYIVYEHFLLRAVDDVATCPNAPAESCGSHRDRSSARRPWRRVRGSGVTGSNPLYRLSVIGRLYLSQIA